MLDDKNNNVTMFLILRKIWLKIESFNGPEFRNGFQGCIQPWKWRPVLVMSWSRHCSEGQTWKGSWRDHLSIKSSITWKKLLSWYFSWSCVWFFVTPIWQPSNRFHQTHRILHKDQVCLQLIQQGVQVDYGLQFWPVDKFQTHCLTRSLSSFSFLH